MKVNDPGRKLVIYTQGEKKNLELLAQTRDAEQYSDYFWLEGRETLWQQTKDAELYSDLSRRERKNLQ